MKHPLLNPKSTHYDHGTSFMLEQESKRTLKSMMDIAKFNADKYEKRLHYKGQKNDDFEKIKGYKRYLEFLKEVERRIVSNEDELVQFCDIYNAPLTDVYVMLDIEMDYTLA